MMLGAIAQIIAFGLCALIAIAGALGMATTMSMFRSGIFLMASFIGVAGLFILLSADLLGLLQIMMYIGGMLVMILFMVLFSHDPGGAMMAGMEMAPIEKFFSLGLLPRQQQNASEGGMAHDGNGMQHAGHGQHSADHADHGEASGKGHEMEHARKGDHGQDDSMQQAGAHQEHAEHSSEQDEENGHDDHMLDMSMTTPIKRPAVVLSILVGGILVGLLLLRPAWPVVATTPDPNSAERVGSLLMGKYMLAFEGAGLLILIGIFGSVLLARAGQFPDARDRAARVAVDAQPTPAGAELLQPFDAHAAPGEAELVSVTEAHDEMNVRGER